MGATGEDYSAPGMLALEGLKQALAKPPFPSRLGEYWLAVQAGLAEAPMEDLIFRLLDQIDDYKGKVPLSVQRREHLEMWLLLGDPALRLPISPLDVTLQSPGPVFAGKQIAVSGTLPGRLAGAAVHVTLERPNGAKPLGVDNAGAPHGGALRPRQQFHPHRRHAEASPETISPAPSRRHPRFPGATSSSAPPPPPPTNLPSASSP